MSVRTRLIVAFLALSVLPLSAVTLYSYTSSVSAFRGAVASESARLAADLEQRLDTVTADLSRQVGLLWEPSLASAEDAGAAANLPVEVRVVEGIAAVLGESARFFERVEFTRTPVPPGPPSPSTSRPTPASAPAPPAPPLPPPVVVDLGETMAAVEKRLAAEGVPPAVAERLRAVGENLGPALQAGVQIAGVATRSAAASMSEEARQRAREHFEHARTLAVANRRAALAGDALAVPIVRDGELVGSVNAQLNLPRTLATVLGSAQASQGEVPFAIDADGVVHTTKPDHAQLLEALHVERSVARACATPTSG
jgi:hypothetical protein